LQTERCRDVNQRRLIAERLRVYACCSRCKKAYQSRCMGRRKYYSTKNRV